LGRFSETLSLTLRKTTSEPVGLALDAVKKHLDDEMADSVSTFEGVLNQCLDAGYRRPALMGFVFEVLRDRFAARIYRRLSRSGRRPSVADVEELVGVTTEAIHVLIQNANRARHTLTYALLLSIADHRTIDYLRRKKPELRDQIDLFHTKSAWGPDSNEVERPDNALIRQDRIRLARTLRAAVLCAVNELPLEERAALILVEVEGLGYDQIADILDVKRTDVGNLVRRARLKRDRNLMPRLRGMTELGGHVGFTTIQGNRDLRLNLLRWTTEMGDGVCGSCVKRVYKLHTADVDCFESEHQDSDEAPRVAVQ
jgi:RNA polymerase sigma factor (sigma-70 family)